MIPRVVIPAPQQSRKNFSLTPQQNLPLSGGRIMGDELNATFECATTPKPDTTTHKPMDTTTLEPGDTTNLEPTMTQTDWQALGIQDNEPFRMLSPG